MSATSSPTQTAAVTPGQFALFRILFGAFLLQYFLRQLPDTALARGTAFLMPAGMLAQVMGVLSLAFLLGLQRRLVAAVLGALWAITLTQEEWGFASHALPCIGLLGLCASVPNGEALSVSYRPTRAGRWSVPRWVFRAGWGMLAGGYLLIGLWKLAVLLGLLRDVTMMVPRVGALPGLPLLATAPDELVGVIFRAVMLAEILFLPAASWPRIRPGAWVVMLAVEIAAAATVKYSDLSLGMVMVHVFAFDSSWLPARSDARRPVLLYDGECGLCNGIVRLLLRDDAGGRLRFAPLQGAPAQAYLRTRGLPTADFDSLVFVPDWERPESGAPQLRTAGALGALDEIGGVWRVVAGLRLLPAALRDPVYKAIARSRYALFGKYQPTPLPEPAWAQRFLP